MINSFDVFDTLITRKTGTPKGVFAVVQERLERQFPNSKVARNFFTWRVQAERTARADSIHEDVTYEEIYACFQQYAQDAEFTSAAKSLELDVELEFIVGIQENIELIRSLMLESKRVILISDMYLPSAEIRKLLAKCAPDIADSCPLYVSGELRRTKSSGSMFHHVAEQENIDLNQLRHTGDNRYSDVQIPRSLGIAVQIFEKAHLKSWERIGQVESDPLWQKISGAAKHYRLSCESTTRHGIGYSIVGPMMGAYVAWLLRQADRHGVELLCFFSRDGYLLKKLAEAMGGSHHDASCQFKYLHGSRMAFRKTALNPFDNEAQKWSLFTFARNTINGIEQRLGVTPGSISKHFPQLPANERLSAKSLTDIKQVFRDETLVAQIQEASKIQKRLFADYLNQQNINTDQKIGVVDIGWGGTLQACLKKTLGDTDALNMMGFYFGISDDHLEKLKTSKDAVSFEYEHHGCNVFYRDAKFFEILASAPEGSTVGYQRDGEKVSPELDGQGKQLIQWGYEDLVAGACAFVAEHAELLRSTSHQSFWCDFARAYLGYLKGSSLCTEFVESLGSYPFTPDSDENGLLELGPALSVGDAIKYIFAGPQRRVEITLWPRGSSLRSSRLVKWIMGDLTGKYLRYLAKPWYLYELLPYPVVMKIMRFTPKFVVKFLQRRIYGCEIH